MMKNNIYLIIAFSLFYNASIAQIQVDEPKNEKKISTTEGFFVKNGSVKIDLLDCYTFSDLIIAFDLKEEHFICDRIKIGVIVGNADAYDEYYYKIDKEEFYNLFKEKEYAYFRLISLTDDKKESLWSNEYNGYLTRSQLQHSIHKKNLDDSKIKVIVYCGTKYNKHKEYQTAVDGTIVEFDLFDMKWTTSTEFSIDLKNRIFIKYGKFFVSGYPKEPVGEGKCFN